jgi:hypothetical protein
LFLPIRLLLALIPLLLSACSTTISPAGHVGSAPDSTFSHELLDEVLSAHVDEQGRVDYTALQAQRQTLDRYYALIAAFSPDSHPELFGGETAALTYWINAYNAAVLQAVLANYPITSVGDVSGPPLAGLVSDQIGFFYFQKLVFGGEKLNLYNLEKEVIRKRFPDPRIHFAINCASGGCPRLPRTAFRSENLEAELEREARFFLNEERNLRIDDGTRTIHLSCILDWYRQDFLRWMQEARPESADPDLLDYARLYLTEERRAALDQAEAAGYKVQPIPYNWSLNDQKP